MMTHQMLDLRFAEAMLPSPAPGSTAYKLLHPSLNEALAQNLSTRRKISQFSKDNLAAIAGNTVPPPKMPVPPPFIPQHVMVGVGARNKSSSTVTATT